MKEFFVALLFGNSISLTPTPISVGPGCVDLKPPKVLEAVNSGAVLQIRLVPGTNGTPKMIDTVAAPQELDKLYPHGVVTALLYKIDGSKVAALNTDVATSRDFYGLMLRPPVALNVSVSSVPAFNEGDKFTRVEVCSKVPMTNVTIYWQTSME